ncbi:uncharacterized protein FSUBG_11454 [Fusarium subglutinans]|uniref:Uncharacterized protein n=1 Tax=Gibberella subglutinans TaxID=42677 RepID=A0A8H5LB12_GIBSU|nr:uncharacterized protein FSUBG_11454 [Fusarium subglutinans]KAF5588597.1 hypothetical protein FSUBG_11454 [Fusarium subglutinans]
MESTSNKKKPEWKTRSNLAAKGFFYNDNISTKALPDHVKALRDSILNFKDHGSGKEFDNSDRRIRDRAKNCVTGDVSEPNWKIFFVGSFLTPLVERTSASHGSRKVDPCNNGNNNIVGIKAVLEVPEESTSSSVESFSYSGLEELYQYGLRPSPFNAFKKRATEKELRCFPWLIIEMKKKHTQRGRINKSKEEASCQAANGSGCAVRLNQIAAKFAVELPGQGQIPPIPAVTTAGPEVKVWITYFARNFMAQRKFTTHVSHTARGQYLDPIDQGYMMQCIWTGDITDLEDVKKFRLILDNTYNWATQVLKPMMNTYIRQWNFVYSEAVRSFATAAMERERQRKELSRKTLRFVLAALGDEADLDTDDDLRRAAKLRLVNLCDAFVQDTDQIIAEELEKLYLKNADSEDNEYSEESEESDDEDEESDDEDEESDDEDEESDDEDEESDDEDEESDDEDEESDDEDEESDDEDEESDDEDEESDDEDEESDDEDEESDDEDEESDDEDEESDDEDEESDDEDEESDDEDEESDDEDEESDDEDEESDDEDEESDDEDEESDDEDEESDDEDEESDDEDEESDDEDEESDDEDEESDDEDDDEEDLV